MTEKYTLWNFDTYDASILAISPKILCQDKKRLLLSRATKGLVTLAALHRKWRAVIAPDGLLHTLSKTITLWPRNKWSYWLCVTWLDCGNVQNWDSDSISEEIFSWATFLGSKLAEWHEWRSCIAATSSLASSTLTLNKTLVQHKNANRRNHEA